MGNYEGRARLLWRLSHSGVGTVLNANGNSGPFNPASQNSVTPIDLRYTTDLALMVYVAGPVTGASATLVVNLNTFDSAGNLFGPVMATAAITAANTGKVAYAGLFSGAGAQVVFPEWGQISWTLAGTSPVFNGAEISLYGR